MILPLLPLLLLILLIFPACGDSAPTQHITSTIPIPSCASPCFTDPLRNNNQGYGWDEGGTDTSGCSFTDAGYNVKADSTEITPCFARSLHSSQCTYDVNIQVMGGTGGLIFGDDNEYYYFFIDAKGDYAFSYVSEQAYIPLIMFENASESTTTSGGDFTLTLDIFFPFIKLSINGGKPDNVNVKDRGISQITQGHVGLGAGDLRLSTPSNVVFTHLDVDGSKI